MRVTLWSWLKSKLKWMSKGVLVDVSAVLLAGTSGGTQVRAKLRNAQADSVRVGARLSAGCRLDIVETCFVAVGCRLLECLVPLAVNMYPYTHMNKSKAIWCSICWWSIPAFHVAAHAPLGLHAKNISAAGRSSRLLVRMYTLMTKRWWQWAITGRSYLKASSRRPLATAASMNGS